MKNVKRIISLFLAVIICILASACGETTSPTRKKKKIVVIKRRSADYSDSSETEDNDNDFEEEYGDDYTDDYIDGGDIGDDLSTSDKSKNSASSNKNSASSNKNSASSDDAQQDDTADEESYVSDRPLWVKDDDTVEIEEREQEYEVKKVKFTVTDDYSVIYPDGNIQLRAAAKKLVNYFSKNGVRLSLASDTAQKKDKEILVGNTNRKKSSLSDNKFAVSVLGKKLFFESGNFNGAVKAVSWFISLKYKKGEINTLTGKYDFVSKLNRADGVYKFVWGDEFDGNALDNSKWELSSAISAGSSFKLSRDPKAMSVSEGLLKLSALRWFDPDNNQVQAIAPYTVEGKEHVNFQYGYLEMRARFPFGGGAWPSLWLSGACGTNSGAVVSSLFKNGDISPSNFSAEVDIVEYTTLQPNLHKWFYEELSGITDRHSSLGDVMKLTSSEIGLDISQSYVYQTVGFEWTPEKMTVYLNGKEYFTYNWTKSVQLDKYNDMSDFLNPLFIRINNHLLPENIPSDYSSLPCEYFVDYIRLYQKSATGGLWLAE